MSDASWLPKGEGSKADANPTPQPDASQQARAEIDWQDLLLMGKKNKPLACLANVITALTYAEEWHELFSFNEFTFEVVTQRKTPWGKPVGSIWTDVDDSRAAAWLQRAGILAASKTVAEATQVVARDRSFHPVRDMVKKLKLDDKSRLDHWLITYLGAPDTPYVRAVGKRWMISLMARVFEPPPCKADHVLLLEGPQGKKKSTALAILVGNEYFSDRLSDVSSKDAMVELRGKWVIEMSELPNLRGHILDRFKAFITSTSDYFREPYARRATEHPRQCILAASTNSTEPFVDPTGTRRIWPVGCGEINLDLLRADREQLLAEAYACYLKGNKWWLETAELEQLANQEQDERYEVGVWDELILDWLENPTRRETREGYGSSQNFVPVTPWDGSEAGKATINDILVHAVGKDRDRLTQADYKAAARCLEHAKWKRKQDRTRGSQRGKRFYYSPERFKEQRW